MNVGPAFYILLVALAGEPAYQWRIEGGWDSCINAQTMVLRYATARLSTECLSRCEWEARGKPGLMPSANNPKVKGA